MSQTDALTDRQVRDRLRAFDEAYRLECDVVRCVHCKRSCHIDRASEDFQHAAWCSRSDATQRPWQTLREALSGIDLSPTSAHRAGYTAARAPAAALARAIEPPAGYDDVELQDYVSGFLRGAREAARESV